MKKLTALTGAAILALTLTACGGDDSGGGNDLDEETATQAGYNHAQETASQFGVSEAADLCDTYASGDEDAWREHVNGALQDMDDFRHSWGDEMFRGA